MPGGVPSLGPAPAAPCTLDTDSLAVGDTGLRGRLVRAGDGTETAVFTFDGGDWPLRLCLRGGRSAVLHFRGSVRLTGRVDASGVGALRGLRTDGAPGGVLHLGATGRLDLRGMRVSLEGRPGHDAASGDAGHGGPGGLLVLHAPEVRLDPHTVLSVAGGRGGDAGAAGRGGAGGAGGRVVAVTARLDPGGAVFDVFGGRPGAGGRAGRPGPTGLVRGLAMCPPGRDRTGPARRPGGA